MNFEIGIFAKSLKHSIGIFILLLLVSGWKMSAEADTQSDRLNFANGLYARGMYKLAIKEFNGYLADNPDTTNNPAIYFRLGESYRELGKLSDADRAYRIVFNKYGNSKYALKAGCRRADLFIQTGDFDAALDLFSAVMAKNPPPEIAATCSYFSGEALQKKGEIKQSIQKFNTVIEKYPDSSFKSYAYLKLGDIYATKEQNIEKAVEFFKKAADINATDRVKAESLFQIAELYFRVEDYEKSADYYRELINKYPDDTRTKEAGLQSSWAAYYAGMYAESLSRAVAALNGGNKLPANDTAEWLYLKANSERQLHKNKDAVKTYARLIKEFPESSFADAARYEKAVAFYKSGEYENALQAIRDVNLNGKMRKDAYWLMAESSAALKRNDAAIQYYQIIVKEFPDSDISAQATYRLAYMLQQRKDYTEAAATYLLLAERFPDNKLAPQAMFAAAYCQFLNNHKENAVQTWKQLISNYPESTFTEQALYQCAMAEITLKRDDDALATIRTLLKNYPDTKYAPDAWYWKGVILLQENKLQDAKDALKTVLSLNPRPELKRNASYSLGLAFRQAKQNKKAVQQLYPLLAGDMSKEFSPQLLTWMAETFYTEKEYDKAITTLQILLQNSTEPEWQQTGWALIGRNEAARGNNKAAADAYRNALAFNATTRFAAESSLRLGEYSLAADDTGNAEQYFSKAAAIASGTDMADIRANAYANLGKTAEKENKFADAARYYMSVAILYSDPVLVPECLAAAARTFKKADMPDDAEKALKELKTRYPSFKNKTE